MPVASTPSVKELVAMEPIILLIVLVLVLQKYFD
jgi:hypothetical protein